MDIFGQKDATDSPCIGICSTSLGDAVCIGCGRTFEEVHRWNTMDDDQKRQINQRLLKSRQESQQNDQQTLEVVDNFA